MNDSVWTPGRAASARFNSNPSPSSPAKPIGKMSGTPSTTRLLRIVPAPPGWERTRTTLCTGNPVSREISFRAGSISRYRSRQKSPTTAMRSFRHLVVSKWNRACSICPNFVLSLMGQCPQERCGIAIVGNDNVGAGVDELRPLHRIHAAGAVVVFIAGHRHGQPAQLAGVQNFNRPVAETEQVLALEIFFGEDFVEHRALRELGRVRRTAENPVAKVARQIQQPRLLFDAVFQRPAQDVEFDAALLKKFEHGSSSKNDKLIGARRFAQNRFRSFDYNLVQPALVLMEQLLRCGALGVAGLDALYEILHLNNGGPAVGGKNLRHQNLANFRKGLIRSHRVIGQEYLTHQFRPAVAQPGKRAVEIKDRKAQTRAWRKAGPEFHQPRKWRGFY